MGVIKSKRSALLLVGASGGIGTVLLEYLAARMDLVCIPTFHKNRPASNRFPWVYYDSNDFESTRTLLEAICKQYELSLVIDASGSFFASKLQKVTPTNIHEVISTNLVAPLILAKNAQDFMSVGGKIVFMSSIVSGMELIGSSAYAASKAGLERAILTLKSEFDQTGHGICGIRLGYMDYGMTYKINARVRQEVLGKSNKSRFIQIEILGDKILEIETANADEINGMLYEIR